MAVPPSTSSVPRSSRIEIGPGPQAIYAVQPQPAPGSCHYRHSGGYPLPDPRCTPGAVSPQVSQATIGTTICRRGYTTTVRPPQRVTAPEKLASAAAYGYTGSMHTAEYDHLIPLELGGDPNDDANLWVEPNDRAGAATTYNSKDAVENALKRLVCSGQLLARHPLAGRSPPNWVAAYARYG